MPSKAPQNGTTGTSADEVRNEPIDLGSLLVVRVIDPDGKPVPHARAALLGESWDVEGRELDGHVVFAPPREASTLRVWDARDASFERLPFGAVDHGRVPVGPGEIEVRLTAEKAIAGTARDPAGRGVAGVRVRATDFRIRDQRYAGWSFPVLSEATTDESGAFRLGGLEQRDHSVEADAPSEWIRPDATRVAPGGGDLRIDLRPGVSAVVTVLDGDGRPVSGEEVEATDDAVVTRVSDVSTHTSHKRRAWGQTNEDGIVRLTGMASGRTFRLFLYSQSGRGDLKQYENPGWVPRDTIVRLVQLYAVRGVVRDARGDPIEGATVTRSSKPYVDGDTATKADGSFAFEHLEAGPVTLRAARTRDDKRLGRAAARRAETTVAAGAQDVVLVIDRGADLSLRIYGEDRGEGVETGALTAILRAESPEEWMEDASEKVGKDGRVSFGALYPDLTYTLWVAAALPDGLNAFRSGLRPGGSEVAVHLERGGTLAGRLRLPDGATDVSVRASAHGFQAWGVVAADGRYAIRGLPPGPWEVFASALVGEARYSALEDSAAGPTLDLTLEPPDPPAPHRNLRTR